MHAVETDLSARSLRALREKLYAAVENGEKEMAEACRAELLRRKEPEEE